MAKFFTLLNGFKIHKAVTNDTQKSKNRVMKNATELYSDYFDSYKETYDTENSNEVQQS